MARVTVTGEQVRFGAGFAVTFQRTLRIPDDGRSYPLPPGLGRFPVRRVDDVADRVPAEWREHGGVLIPMYQREALWLSFSGQYWKPRAVKVGVGKVCAITGKPWRDRLHDEPQDYLVAPPQPWLDGICVAPGRVRQFVAMPLGLGYTVEGQVTGDERFGGIQLRVVEPKPGRFPDLPPPPMVSRCSAPPPAPCGPPRAQAGALGLGAGGSMRQKIYPDPHGIDTWDEDNATRLFVHIVTSELWREITGEAPPPTPVTAKEYARRGLPWFDRYDEHACALPGTDALARVQSVKAIDADKSALSLQDDASVEPGPVKKFWAKTAGGLDVRDGKW